MTVAPEIIEASNRGYAARLDEDVAAIERRLPIASTIVQRLKAFSVAIPSWGVGTGGTRFARFPQPGEPRDIFDKIEDCGLVQALGRMTRTVSPHFPWDRTADWAALREHAAAHGLGFDAVNSNTFQDQAGQALSYRHGSLAHTDARVRAQAVQHNLDCIDAGKALGSTALTVWIADGSNYPGQQDFTAAFERYLESTAAIRDALPGDWRMFLEHKLFEPAFYASVIADWGTSLLAAQTLGPKVQCLVDLGHHAPTTNVELIVARLAHAGKLGGFHFNDSKYGDDDLDSGSIDPFRLFLVFQELEGIAQRDAGFAPALMIDQSHNITDPIESLLLSADAIALAFARSLAVDRAALSQAQEANDVIDARQLLANAF